MGGSKEQETSKLGAEGQEGGAATDYFSYNFPSSFFLQISQQQLLRNRRLPVVEIYQMVKFISPMLAVEQIRLLIQYALPLPALNASFLISSPASSS